LAATLIVSFADSNIITAAYPMKQVHTVVQVPWSEDLLLFFTRTPYYLWLIITTIFSLMVGTAPKRRVYLTDQEIIDHFTRTIAAQGLIPAKSPPTGSGDDDIFYAYEDITDGLEPIDGTFSSKCKAMLRSYDGDERDRSLELVSIDVNGEVFGPSDGNHWELAKVYLASALHHDVRLYYHAIDHLFSDTIDLATRKCLPNNHPIRILLQPHLELNLALDVTVLWSTTSPISDVGVGVIYNGFAYRTPDIRTLLTKGTGR